MAIILLFILEMDYRLLRLIKHEDLNPNVCPVKIRSKHSSNTLLCLLRIFTGQTL